jgi:hypothetical protein
MNTYKVTYFNGNAYNSVLVKARSLESATNAEKQSVAMFQRVNPRIQLVSVEVA